MNATIEQPHQKTHEQQQAEDCLAVLASEGQQLSKKLIPAALELEDLYQDIIDQEIMCHRDTAGKAQIELKNRFPELAEQEIALLVDPHFADTLARIRSRQLRDKAAALLKENSGTVEDLIAGWVGAIERHISKTAATELRELNTQEDEREKAARSEFESPANVRERRRSGREGQRFTFVRKPFQPSPQVERLTATLAQIKAYKYEPRYGTNPAAIYFLRPLFR